MKRLYLKCLSATLDPTDEEDLKAWIKDPLLPDTYITDECHRFWEVLKEETTLQPEIWPAIVQRACKAYCALENAEKAKEWALLGLFLNYICAENDGGWAAVCKAPEKTDWWGLRRASKK
jgi:hypothetical protein